MAAIKAYPGGMQLGGGINPSNAKQYLDAGTTCVYTYIYGCVYTYVCVHMYICMGVYVCICIFIYMGVS